MKKFKQQFGCKMTPELKATYEQSPQWKADKFENQVETNMSLSIWDVPELLYKQFCKKDDREPQSPLPIAPFDVDAFLADDVNFKCIWYGHSVVLIRMSGKTILIDPMLGPNASPIAPFKTKRFSENTLDLIDELPPIDLMLLTHDHYDHLDLDSIEKLKSKTKQYYVALGVKRHLTAWGIDAAQVREFDWWDQANFDSISITFTPTRHFSGRGVKDRAKSLWGGWVLKSDHENIWFSGDGGYGEHFKEVGAKLGPFDFGFMECGQYNEKWHPIHLFPEESVQAAIDGQVKKAMPVHWAGFALAQHSWTEPADDFHTHAQTKGLTVCYPPLGETLTLNSEDYQAMWWNELKGSPAK